MFKTHISFGFLSGILAIPYLNPANQILFMALVMMGALLPDVDHPKSKLGRNVKLIGYLFEHRGFFHSFLMIPVIAFIIWHFTQSYVYIIPLGVGYASHLVSDAITKEGIMPFHPLSRFRLRGFIRTGGFAEYIFLFFTFVLAVYSTIHL